MLFVMKKLPNHQHLKMW